MLGRFDNANLQDIISLEEIFANLVQFDGRKFVANMRVRQILLGHLHVQFVRPDRAVRPRSAECRVQVSSEINRT